MWERIFCKRAGWHLTTSSLQINFFMDDFQGFLVNKNLQIATSRSFNKILEKHLWISFLLCMLIEILQVVSESFPEVLFKKGFLKNISKFTGKHKKQSSGGVSLKSDLKNLGPFIGEHFCRGLFFNKVSGRKPKTSRTIYWKCSVKKDVFKKFHKFHRKKTPVLESLFNKVTGLRPCNLIKNGIRHKCFPVKLSKFLRTAMLKNIHGRLLLNFNKKRLERRWFAMNFVVFSTTPFMWSIH